MVRRRGVRVPRVCLIDRSRTAFADETKGFADAQAQNTTIARGDLAE
jgi:hypothetical protein